MILLVILVLLNGSPDTEPNSPGWLSGRYSQKTFMFDTLAACQQMRDRVTSDANHQAVVTYVSRCGTKADTLMFEVFSDRDKPLPAAVRRESF